jgi:hypothetical protein
MIKYNLQCKNNHEFESWFSSSSEYEKLRKKKLLECIYCKSLKIEKSIMSPSIVASKKIDQKGHDRSKEFNLIRKDLIKIKKFVEKNFEFVGDKFTQEVRDMHYNKHKNKNIYGTASLQEKQELEDEGIELESIPWINTKEN